MPEAAGENKIVIDLVLRMDQLEKQLKETQSKLTGLGKSEVKREETRKRGGKQEKKDDAEILKGKERLVKVYESLSKHSRGAASNWGTIRKHLTEVGKIINKIDKQGQPGFFTGLARGTGLAGIYRSIAGQPGGPGFGQRAGGAIGRTGVGLAARGLGWFLGAMQQAVGVHERVGMAKWGMAGMGLGGGRGLDVQRMGGGGFGTKYGFAPSETYGMAPGVARATGSLYATRMAQQMALAGGYGPGGVGQAVNLMQTMRQGGQGFAPGAQQAEADKKLTKIITMGTYSGLDKANLPEYFDSVQQLIQTRFRAAGGDVDPLAIARAVAELGARGGVGFRGARGAQMAGMAERMIRAPGGGPAGQAMVMQALGYGMPGSKMGFYQAQKEQERGFTGEGGYERLIKVLEYVTKTTGGSVALGGKDPRNQMANLMIREMGGFSLEQSEKLIDIAKSTKEDSKERRAEIEKLIEESKPLEKRADEAMIDGFASTKAYYARIEGVQAAAAKGVVEFTRKWQSFQIKMLSDLAPYLVQILKKLEALYDWASSLYWPWGQTAALKDVEKAGKTYQPYKLSELTNIEKAKNALYTELLNKGSAAAKAKEIVTAKREEWIGQQLGGEVGAIQGEAKVRAEALREPGLWGGDKLVEKQRIAEQAYADTKTAYAQATKDIKALPPAARGAFTKESFKELRERMPALSTLGSEKEWFREVVTLLKASKIAVESMASDKPAVNNAHKAKVAGSKRK